MDLDTSFLGGSSDVVVEAPAADTGVIDSVQTEDTTPVTDPVAPVEAVPADQVAEEQAKLDLVESDELSEEELQKLADNPNAPKWFRDKLKQVSGYSGKLKAEKTALQEQLETYKSQYEGKEALPQTDLERLRVAEEKFYKLSSYTAPVEEVLSSIQEVVSPNKLAELKSHLTWDFLEKADGQPDLENLQVIIDRFSGYKEGDTRVAAKDVLNAIQAIKRGTVTPENFHEFASDEEYQAYQRAREVDSEVELQRQLAKDNAEYQERATRQAMLQNVLTGIQSQFQPQVEALFNKFQLNFTDNDPKVAKEFKQEVRNKLAAEINAASSQNPSLVDVFKALDLLGKPSGQRADSIQAEINNYVNSFPYQTAVSRGLSELMQTVEKTIAAEAYRYKLLMAGWSLENTKGQNAREVVGAPKQTEVLTEYSEEELAGMSAAERRHARLTQLSNQLRQKTPRFGG